MIAGDILVVLTHKEIQPHQDSTREKKYEKRYFLSDEAEFISLEMLIETCNELFLIKK
jgi:hypothetical protein